MSDLRKFIQNPGVCSVCGKPAFVSVNVAPGVASGGSMETRCDEHNPYAAPSPSLREPPDGWRSRAETLVASYSSMIASAKGHKAPSPITDKITLDHGAIALEILAVMLNASPTAAQGQKAVALYWVLTDKKNHPMSYTNIPAVAETWRVRQAEFNNVVPLFASPVPASGEGWVMVPRQPTGEMYNAFFACGGKRPLPEDEAYEWEGDFGNFFASYLAMLAAAPKGETE